MTRFQQYQMGQAMTAAADNPAGGGAAEGMGLGMGFAMASQMMRGAGSTAAPPAPAAPLFHVTRGGQTHGPFTMEQLAGAIARGEVAADTLVWTAGMANWTPAGQVPQLAAQFGPPPPPPPSSS
jgi:hypothetical protein